MSDDQAFLLLTAEEMNARAAVHAWWQARLARRGLSRSAPLDTPALPDPNPLRP
jgi:hypothetical protein